MINYKEILEAKKKTARELKKILESSDFGYTEAGGNGRCKIKGKNLIVYNSYWAGSQRHLDNLIKSWSPKGSNYEYFKEEGFDIKIINSGSEPKSKIYKGEPSVWVELSVT